MVGVWKEKEGETVKFVSIFTFVEKSPSLGLMFKKKKKENTELSKRKEILQTSVNIDFCSLPSSKPLPETQSFSFLSQSLLSILQVIQPVVVSDHQDTNSVNPILTHGWTCKASLIYVSISRCPVFIGDPDVLTLVLGGRSRGVV